jgi:plastocyanin
VVVVTYQDFAIVPAALSIPAGTTIQFVMESASGAFHRPINSTKPNVFQAPDQLGNGATYNQIFSQPGTVTLLCAYHPEMKATLTVTP